MSFMNMFRAGAVAGIAAAVPEVNVLGTYDLNLVEVTPVVVQDELYLFESVRASYWQFSPEAAGGAEYLRFVHMLSGNATPAFGAGHALGCALVEEEEEEDHPRGGGGGGGAPAAAEPGVYAFGTRRAFGATAFPPAAGDDDGSAISVFWSIDGMQTWQNRTAIDFKKEADPRRKKRTVFNTSVGKGKLNGTTAYVLAYEWSNPATPGGWNTNFAVSRDLKGWQLLDDDAFAMPADVEHADPTLRYVEADGYWYCIPARRDPPPGGGLALLPGDLPQQGPAHVGGSARDGLADAGGHPAAAARRSARHGAGAARVAPGHVRRAGGAKRHRAGQLDGVGGLQQLRPGPVRVEGRDLHDLQLGVSARNGGTRSCGLACGARPLPAGLVRACLCSIDPCSCSGLLKRSRRINTPCKCHQPSAYMYV